MIGAWLAFIVLAQGISGALGGANYKDTFSLPHTETASVAKVLKNAGLDSQNGATGTVVLKAKTGTLQSAPPRAAPALRKLCTSGNHVSAISHALAVDRLHEGAARRRGRPEAAEHRQRFDHRPGQHHLDVEPLRPEVVHKRLQRAEESA